MRQPPAPTGEEAYLALLRRFYIIEKLPITIY